jgi:hypothetical protein
MLQRLASDRRVCKVPMLWLRHWICATVGAQATFSVFAFSSTLPCIRLNHSMQWHTCLMLLKGTPHPLLVLSDHWINAVPRANARHKQYLTSSWHSVRENRFQMFLNTRRLTACQPFLLVQSNTCRSSHCLQDPSKDTAFKPTNRVTRNLWPESHSLQGLHQQPP